MRKRICLILIVIVAALLFSALPVHAVDGVEWGIFEDYTIIPNKYAFNKIFNKEPITYYIGFENEKIEENEDLNNNEDITIALKTIMKKVEEKFNLSETIENAFNIWFKDTKNMIIADGRREEFADILPLLSKKMSLEKVNKLKDADVIFVFVEDISKFCHQKAAGCITWKKSYYKHHAIVRLPNPTKNTKNYGKKEIFHILTHEIGHYFGLTDQYYQENPKLRDFYIYDEYSNPRIGYQKSTMGASYTIGLDCDDVDGFINLIDLSLSGGNQEKFSTRAQNSWASFCNEKREYFTDTYYHNAKPIKTTIADWVKTPFNAYGRILSYDEKGRILTTTDGKNKYVFDYTETEKDNFISALRDGKEFKIKYGKDEFNTLMWAGEGNKPWGGSFFSSNNKAVCFIHYSKKEFKVENGKCYVKDVKDTFSAKEDLESEDYAEDPFSLTRFQRTSFSESEIQKEYKLLEEHICPFIQTECSFFKRIYKSMD